MAFNIIPLDSVRAFYNFKVTLDGSTYTIVVRWNERAGIWVHDLKTENEQDIVLGKPILTNTDLLRPVTDENKPQGLLFAYNLNDGKTDAVRDTLGSDVVLVYSDAEA